MYGRTKCTTASICSIVDAFSGDSSDIFFILSLSLLSLSLTLFFYLSFILSSFVFRVRTLLFDVCYIVVRLVFLLLFFRPASNILRLEVKENKRDCNTVVSRMDFYRRLRLCRLLSARHGKMWWLTDLKGVQFPDECETLLCTCLVLRFKNKNQPFLIMIVFAKAVISYFQVVQVQPIQYLWLWSCKWE